MEMNKKKSEGWNHKTVYVFIAVGVLSVFVGYISVAPPTDLPVWPLYSLNAKVWQSFERWGQHVKPYHMRIMTTALQHIESRALYILSYLGIPDIIHEAGKPLSCEEIKLSVDEIGYDHISLPYLCRILHAAAHFDFLQEAGHDKYALTPLSEYLVSSHPKSLRNFVKLYSGDEALVISTALSRSIFSGQSGFKETYRQELLEYLKVDSSLQETYDNGESDISRLVAPAIIADYPPFGNCKHICDVGGGLGTFLHAVLNFYSFGIKGTNFDLPDVIKSATEYMKVHGATNKIAMVAGNFSKEVPKLGCDCYILKDILENWSDEDAAVILTNLHSAIPKASRVLVIERILHTGSFSEERFKSLIDLTMMSFHPSHSRLRSEEEFLFLLEQTGFQTTRSYSTRAGYSIIETAPSS